MRIRSRHDCMESTRHIAILTPTRKRPRALALHISKCTAVPKTRAPLARICLKRAFVNVTSAGMTPESCPKCLRLSRRRKSARPPPTRPVPAASAIHAKPRLAAATAVAADNAGAGGRGGVLGGDRTEAPPDAPLERETRGGLGGVEEAFRGTAGVGPRSARSEQPGWNGRSRRRLTSMLQTQPANPTKEG